MTFVTHLRLFVFSFLFNGFCCPLGSSKSLEVTRAPITLSSSVRIIPQFLGFFSVNTDLVLIRDSRNSD